MARGCARKNDGSFHTLAISSSRSSGVGAPLRVLMRMRRRGVGEQAVVLVVDELALLALLHLLDEEAELLLDLVEGVAVEVGHARLHVEHGRHRVEEVLARVLVVVDEGLGQVGVAVARRAALDVRRGGGGGAARLLDLVEAVDAGLDGRPRQERDQPARGDAAPLRARLGGVRKLSCGTFGQCSAIIGVVRHSDPSPRLQARIRIFLPSICSEQIRRLMHPALRISRSAFFGMVLLFFQQSEFPVSLMTRARAVTPYLTCACSFVRYRRRADQHSSRRVSAHAAWR